MKKITALLVLVLIGINSFARTAIWDGGGADLVWTNATNWDTDVAPVAGDDVVFNTAGTYTITSVPTLSINSLTITTGNVTLSGSTTTLTLGGNAGTDFTIASSQSLTLTGTGSICNITMATNATSDISGNFTINAGATFTTSNASTVNTVSTSGSITNSGTITGASAVKLLFNGSSTYTHSQAGGTIPTAAWASTSTCTVTGATGAVPSGTGQTFGNFDWNCSSQSANCTLAANFLTAGDFTITNTNTRSILTSLAVTVSGNMSIAANTTLSIPAVAFTVTGTSAIYGTFTITSTTGAKTFNGAVTVYSGGLITETVACTIIYNNNLTINNGGTITEFTTATMTFAGNFQNDGTYTAASGTHTFSGSSKTISGANEISIGTVSITGTITNNSTVGFTVSTALSGAGGLTQGVNAILNCGGTAAMTTKDFTSNVNTVNYTKAGTQTIIATTYHHLGLSGTSAKTTTSVTTINGDFIMAGTATVPSFTVTTIGGDVTLSGSANTLTATDNLAINGGGLNIATGCTIDMSTKILTGVTTTNALYSGSSWGLLKTGCLTTTSATPIPSGLIFSGTIEYNSGLGNQTVVEGSYYNLTISGASSRIKSSSGNISVSGTLSVSATTEYNTNGSTVTIIANGATLTNAGTVTCTDATKLIFEGSAEYKHNQNGGTIPTADWNGLDDLGTSTCNVTGMTSTAPTGLSTTFYHLKFSTSSLGSQTSIASNLTTTGDLTVSLVLTTSLRLVMTNTGTAYTWNIGGDFHFLSTAGTFNFCGSSSSGTPSNTINVTGDFNMTGGATLDFNNSGNTMTGGTQTLNVAGNYTHTAGTMTVNKAYPIEIYFNGSGTQLIESTGQTNAITFKTAQSGAGAIVRVNDTKTFTLGSSSTFIVQNNTDNNTEFEIGTGTSGTFNSTNTSISTFAINSDATAKVYGGGYLKAYSTITNNGALLVDGTYEHYINGGVVPIATWAAASTILFSEIASTTVPTGISGQTFGNFTWNRAGTATNLYLNVSGNVTCQGNFKIQNAPTTSYYLALFGSGSHTLTIEGDFIVQAGNFNFQNGGGASETNIINLKGNFNQTGGVFTHTNSSSLLTINFAGTSTQTFTASGTLTNTYMNWDVNPSASLFLISNLPVAASRTLVIQSGGTLDFSTVLATGAGSATVSSGATVKSGHASGFSTTATTGSIQTTTKTYNSGATYVYNGTSAQATGNFAASISNTVAGLTFDNNAIITLTGSITVADAGTFTLSKGFHTLNGMTLTVGTSAATNFTYTSGGLYGTGSFVRYWPTGAITSTGSNSYGLFPFLRNKFELNSTSDITGGGSITVSPTVLVSGSPTTVDVNYADGTGTVDYIMTGNKITTSNSSISGGTFTVKYSYNSFNTTGNTSDITLVTYTSSVMGHQGTYVANSNTKSDPVCSRTGVSTANIFQAWVIGTYDNTASPLTACGFVTGTKSIGPGGDYATLTAAFADMSAGGGIGSNLILELNSSYTSTAESFPITIAAYGCVTGSNPINIQPAAGANSLVITSSSTTGTILLNGASYVNFDGSPGAARTMSNANNLSIINTSATAGYAIRLAGDATYNKIEYCNIRSNITSTTSGVITFDTPSTATGNSYNEINYNEIYKESTSPTNAIYSLGITGGKNNINNTINGNYIYDYFAAASASNGILLGSFNSVWTITNNRFYQTGSVTLSSAVQHSAININYTSGISFQINNNTIGYASSAGTGTYTFAGNGSAGSKFIPIYLNLGTTATTVKSNTITNLAVSAVGYTLNQTAPGAFTGIAIIAGAVNVGADGERNVIGSTSSNGSITYLGLTNSYYYGIYSSSTSTVNISYNDIGGVETHSSTAAGTGYIFSAIYTSGTAGIPTITYNTIGSTSTTNSIAVGAIAVTTTGVCKFYGIYNSCTGLSTISNNTIQNIVAYGTGASYIYGVDNSGSASNSLIQSNTISSLNMSGVGTAAFIYVINNIAAASITISNNTITSITSNNNDIFGIHDNATATGVHTITSNVIDTLIVTAGSTPGIVGINIAGAGASTYNCSNNTIRNISASVLSTVYGIQITNTGTYECNNNTVTNIIVDAASSQTIIGINCTGAGTYNLSGNSLTNFICPNTGSGISSITGIKLAANLSSVIQKNRMTGYSIGHASTTSIFGIRNSSTGTTLMYNNLFICTNTMYYSPYTEYTTDVDIVGIGSGSIGTGTLAFMTLYYNTIVIGGSTASGSGTASACFSHYHATTNQVLAVKNNIFQNSRTVTGGTTIHYCYSIGGGTAVKSSPGCDYNYYASPTDANFADVGGVKTYATFAVATQGFGGTNSKYYSPTSGNSSAITVNSDGSLSSADLTTVAVGENLSGVSGCTSDINGTAGNRTSAAGYKGCYEGAGTYYWIGGTGNWSDFTSHWANSSGASTANMSIAPGTLDNVVFDANSGAGTATIDAAANALNLTMTGYTGTLAGSSALNVYGNLTAASGMTWSHSGNLNFASTASGKTITSAGKILSSNVIFNGVGGGWTLQDNTIISGSLALTNGTLTVGANNLTLSSSTSPSRTSGSIDASDGSSTLSFTNTSEITLPSSLFTGNLNNLTLNGAGGVTLGENTTVAGVLTLTSGTLNLGANTLTLAGNSAPSRTSGNINASDASANLTFINTSGITLPASLFSGDIGTLTLNGVGGVTLGGNTTVASGLTLSSGALSIGSNTLTTAAISATSGSLTGSGSSSMVLTGTTNLPAISGGLNNLTINSGTTTTLTGNVTIAGTLTATGDLSTGGNALTINGTLAPAAGSIISGDGITGTGTLNVSRTTATADYSSQYTGSNTLTNLTVKYNGAAAQTISALSYGNLFVDNANGLSLGGAVTVNGTLTFNTGKVTLGASNLTIGSAGIVSGYSSSSYVVTDGTGALFQNAIETGSAIGKQFFPVGLNSSSYTPCAINNVGTSDNFSVRIGDQVLTNGTSGTVATDDHVDRTWFVEEATPTGSNVTLTLQWTDNENLSGFTTNSCSISHYTGGAWDDATVGEATGSSPYTRSRSGITSFSPFKVKKGGAPLPVSLIDFKVRKSENVIILDWTTASEVNNESFMVERSADGKTFVELISVSGAGNSNEILYYIAIDNRPLKGISYYRLKQTDYDGTFSYSDLKVVNFDGPLYLSSFNIYPNPAIDSKVTVAFDIEQIEGVQLVIYNSIGMVIETYDIKTNIGKNLINIDLNGNSSGLYLIEIRNNNLPIKSEIIKL